MGDLLKLWTPLVGMLALAAWVGANAATIARHSDEIAEIKPAITDVAVMKRDIEYIRQFIERLERRAGGAPR